ncbi:uncharacterized protein LOC121739522 [Aricia agestis]|uniref:uncharacterized protein LOC121739522 n=1 Tax=Aricia agestis TaxID=91739 RepID=UPI001C203045|nr:uncharacterized protein LOC121739522 [Aricia agestis]
MEGNTEKNIPRVGLRKGESHTPASAGGRSTYTGGAPIAVEEEERRKERINDDFGLITEKDLQNDLIALTTSRVTPEPVPLTAPVAERTATWNEDSLHALQTPVVQLERIDLTDGSRAATPAPLQSKFFNLGGRTSDDFESGNETAVSRSHDEDKERTKRHFRKRRGSNVDESDSESRKGTTSSKSAKRGSKRGRGRPPTTGHYVGLAKARQDQITLEREIVKVEAKGAVPKETVRTQQTRSFRLSESSILSDTTMAEEDAVTRAKLGSKITQSLEVITKVAKTSKNLSGIKTLKMAVSDIQESCAALLRHSTSEETRALEAANTRLSRELSEMKTELATVKRELQNMRPQAAPAAPPDIEEMLKRAVQEAVSLSSARLNARLEGLEARLLPEPRLRPPLAADKRKEREAPATTPAGPSQKEKRTPPPEPSVSTLMPPTNPGPAPKKAKKKKKSAAAIEAAASRHDTATTAAVSQPATTSEWAQVVKKGKADKKAERKAPPKKKKKKSGNKLRVPKTAAVVLTLLPDAAERGVSYGDILEKAKQELDLTALDIPPVRFKRAVTGARMYEVSGPACKEKADALAGKLKEIIGEDVVRVSRPQKCAELRIVGLDDSASAQEIAAAIARSGGCATDDVRVGEIRIDRSGRGTTWVKCPIEAAKQVTTPNTKMYIGWTSVRVTLLSSRPMRCYFCHEIGHTRATCPKGDDRSVLCFRCGRIGHMNAQCSNAPHCALCDGHGKPADHVVGTKGKPCSEPETKKRNGPKKSQATRRNAKTSKAASGAREEILESKIDVAVAAEPYRVLNRDDWLGDADSRVALVFGPKVAPPTSRGITRGNGFVSAKLRALTVVGVYFSPNRALADFESFLLRLTTFVEGTSGPVIIAGDFNAKSTLWGSPATDARGRVVANWLASKGFVLANRGTTSTCVRWQGESIVDLTLSSPTVARRITNWRVLSDKETLSDHRYIRFDVSACTSELGRRTPSHGGPRWSLRRLDREMLKEAAIVAAWNPLPPEGGVEELADWLNDAAHNICDASMPRLGPVKPRGQTYWWSLDLKRLRQVCVAARRRYTRYRRRRNRTEEEEAVIYDAYRTARHNLRDAIRAAKKEAWDEWLESLEQDPWGKPYKLVRQKLRPAAPPLTQTLQPEFRSTIISALFPSRAEWSPPPMASPTTEPEEEVEVPPVTAAELAAAIHKMGKNKAPGLDGVPGKVWELSMEQLESHVLSVLTSCVVQGQVPRRWKTGKLVLLRKNGKPEDQPSAYRPIVLIDEIGKILERIIVARLNQHLENVGPNLSEAQHGFRSCRSTIDAVARLKAITEEEVARGGVVLAVSLDISNAFNSLPWATIEEALKYHRVPRYMRKLIRNYLSERSVQYPTEDGWEEYEVDCGVPQGSALGPTLWNIGFDYVLRCRMLSGAEEIAYADDTLAVCRGKTIREAKILATATVAQIVRRIQSLGLTVALNKSEALLFHGPRKSPPPGLAVTVSGINIEVKSSMTYLGLVLDGRWTFKDHFRRLSERVSRSAGALASLLPNLGGPSLTCRRLYMGVIRSMIMYGAPIWAKDLSPSNRLVLGRVQRTMATRVVRGYRTISKDAACLLAGSVPWDLEARALADVYWRGAATRAGGSNPLPDAVRRWRDQARERTIELWEERLQEPQVSVNLVQAIRPVLKQWLTRKTGALSFRLTQVLTGHGCFGRYLCEIVSREETTRCHHCDCDRDTTEHTVTACPSWIVQRAALSATIGPDLSLPALFRAMLSSEQEWKAVEDFAHDVISAKEEAERIREREALDPRRRSRPRRRRVNLNDQSVPP